MHVKIFATKEDAIPIYHGVITNDGILFTLGKNYEDIPQGTELWGIFSADRQDVLWHMRRNDNKDEWGAVSLKFPLARILPVEQYHKFNIVPGSRKTHRSTTFITLATPFGDIPAGTKLQGLRSVEGNLENRVHSVKHITWYIYNPDIPTRDLRPFCFE